MFITHDEYFEKADVLLDHFLGEKTEYGEATDSQSDDEKNWALVELSALHFRRNFRTNDEDSFVEYNAPSVVERISQYSMKV